ncbi:GNAT family N-acetyltransferase [Thalassobellus sediminis]|uniref:GNAT family N-acetyltransferase n=1 Tax=Thalassobellus sediminis TaxID=3367753 RepID=UPI00378BADD8
MLRRILNTEHSDFNLFHKKTLQEFYIGVYNKFNNDSFFSSEEFETIKSNDKKRLSRVNYVPKYLNLVINEKSEFKKIELNTAEKGFIVNLKKYSDVKNYMLSQFGAKSRSKINSNLKRLELCFNISYKFYYGSISKKEYDFLFKNLYSLIKKRFLEINKEHQAIKKWKQYVDSIYHMVLNKSASIFVIYDDEKPIDICISYHFDNVVFNEIRSFDIDYSKFRLGYVDIYKQLEWCFEQGFDIFDLGMGELRYKKEWCNVVYPFEHHVVFNKKKIINYLLIVITKIYVSISKKIFEFKKKYITKENIKNKFNIKNRYIVDDIYLEKFNSEKNTYLELDIEAENNKHLRKCFYEFLYLNKNLKASTKIFKNISNNKYIIKGNKKIKEIELVA